ncbi:hypothetical protein CDAR_179071 [Caerostris darwini]|uniref:Uncharacterized protein n=1 Tax=Caerostris darwini TaxID=1538125 RepID=A0AAV4PA21_9ARAC|nr:hypothetical protein CDAR_179071 [Caerostris darwini]
MTLSLGDFETQLKYGTTTLPHTLSSACSDDPETKTNPPTPKQPFSKMQVPIHCSASCCVTSTRDLSQGVSPIL